MDYYRVWQEGTDADAANCGDHEFAPESTACCNGCGHWATVAVFTRREHHEDAK
jgi:hypothetical protein